jgi:hypothetical protein
MVPFTLRDADGGLTETEERVDDTPPVMVMGAGALCFVTVPRVPFTVRLTEPAVEPAVNFTEEPMELLRVPKALPSDHTYIVPGGQDPFGQLGIAEKTAVLPVERVDAAGEIAIDPSVVASSNSEAVAHFPLESVTFTVTEVVLTAEGSQGRDVRFWEAHPGGSPV